MSSTGQSDSPGALTGAGNPAAQTRLQRRVLDFRSWPDVFADVDNLRGRATIAWATGTFPRFWTMSAKAYVRRWRGSEHPRRGSFADFSGRSSCAASCDPRMKAGIKVPAWWLPGPGQDESGAIDQFPPTSRRSSG